MFKLLESTLNDFWDLNAFCQKSFWWKLPWWATIDAFSVLGTTKAYGDSNTRVTAVTMIRGDEVFQIAAPVFINDDVHQILT